MKNKTNPPETSAPSLAKLAEPAVREIVRRLALPEPARRHFETARLEWLKGIRALVDARIEHLTKAKSRGERIEVD